MCTHEHVQGWPSEHLQDDSMEREHLVLWQCSCVTSCISFLERPRWKKQLYEWCKMTSRREQHDCLKGFWEGLDQQKWIRMTRCRTWWKSAYASLHLWSICVTKMQTACRYDCWGESMKEYRCSSTKPDLSFQIRSISVTLFFFF